MLTGTHTTLNTYMTYILLTVTLGGSISELVAVMKRFCLIQIRRQDKESFHSCELIILILCMNFELIRP